MPRASGSLVLHGPILAFPLFSQHQVLVEWLFWKPLKSQLSLKTSLELDLPSYGPVSISFLARLSIMAAMAIERFGTQRRSVWDPLFNRICQRIILHRLSRIGLQEAKSQSRCLILKVSHEYLQWIVRRLLRLWNRVVLRALVLHTLTAVVEEWSVIICFE